MPRQAILMGLIAAFTVLSSCGEQIPTIPTSAGKAVVEGEPRSYIVWECGADEWVDPDDATYTIFFHGQFRLYFEGTTVEISEYISPTTKLVYEAGELGSSNFALYAHGSWCAATTELIGSDPPDIRIWRGDVNWMYRNDPQNSRYVLYENDLVYQIGRIEEDDAVGYIDFQSVHHRNNRPILEVGARAVWPVNVDQVKRDSIEVLGQVPADDRPYLLDVICQGAACPDFVQDIEQDTALQDQLVRNFQERQAPQSPSEGQPPQPPSQEVQGEDVPPPSIEYQEPTTKILYTNNAEFVSQDPFDAPESAQSNHDEIPANWSVVAQTCTDANPSDNCRSVRLGVPVSVQGVDNKWYIEITSTVSYGDLDYGDPDYDPLTPDPPRQNPPHPDIRSNFWSGGHHIVTGLWAGVTYGVFARPKGRGGDFTLVGRFTTARCPAGTQHRDSKQTREYRTGTVIEDYPENPYRCEEIPERLRPQEIEVAPAGMLTVDAVNAWKDGLQANYENGKCQKRRDWAANKGCNFPTNAANECGVTNQPETDEHGDDIPNCNFPDFIITDFKHIKTRSFVGDDATYADIFIFHAPHGEPVPCPSGYTASEDKFKAAGDKGNRDGCSFSR